jgi:hypothetical protein
MLKLSELHVHMSSIEIFGPLGPAITLTVRPRNRLFRLVLESHELRWFVAQKLALQMVAVRYTELSPTCDLGTLMGIVGWLG